MMLDFPMLVEKYGIKSKGCLHIGASSGQEAELYNSHGVSKVIWVEALPDVYNKLLAHTGQYGHICVNACIGEEDGKQVMFHVSNNEAQSSSYLEFGTHKVIHSSVDFIEHIPMTTMRVDTMVKGFGIDLADVDLLNLDLQGSEIFALRSMGDLLSQFKYAIIEINKNECYVGCALVEEIDEHMRKFGFERMETGTWVGDTWTDGFYVKN